MESCYAHANISVTRWSNFITSAVARASDFRCALSADAQPLKRRGKPSILELGVQRGFGRLESIL
jgi:hypothetical protein